MLQKKYEIFFFLAASRVTFFLTPGQTGTNSFFSLSLLVDLFKFLVKVNILAGKQIFSRSLVNVNSKYVSESI